LRVVEGVVVELPPLEGVVAVVVVVVLQLLSCPGWRVLHHHHLKNQI
jgi:hypothetical protein